MIKESDELIYIQDENGKEVPFKILKEFMSEDESKHFVFYISVEDDAEEVYVGELKEQADGSGEIIDVEGEDREYCEEVFNEFLNELDAMELEEEDELDEEDGE
ncbi:MAG: hypothetical protein K6G38_03705 [Gammaproteobacteria bacterium]|nr:hypothetical protein [Gammaproteobacteria bacterium]